MKKSGTKSMGMILGILVLFFLFPTIFGNDKAEAAVKISKKSITLAVKETSVLKITGTSKKVSWSSSNSSVASVYKGKVTAKKEGTAVIKATVNKKTYSCKVTVKGNYKTLYKSLLQKGSYTTGKETIKLRYYYVLDLDKNGMPELITTSGAGGFCAYDVFTVRSGKIVYLGSCTNKGVYFDPWFSYSYKYKGIITSGWTNGIGGSWTNMYSISGNKLIRTYHAREAHDPKDAYYTGKTDKSEKKVSRSSCSKFVNTYFKKYKKTYNMLLNQPGNRTKSFG